ncbi:MAG: serine/threonine protein kinase [Phycisphaerales bacterium]|nr:serine/threonine protein kinase [Phycisphaerales bacterium]
MLSPKQAQALAPDLLKDDADDADLPEIIAGCRIVRRIGKGGMGVVYEAQQEHPKRTVAVKLLRQDLFSRTAARRFDLEADLLAHLNHPGIAHIHGTGTHEGTPYFIMEYIPGGRDLIDYAQHAGLSLREKLKLFASVCDAVHHGHQKGVIHRDLKPANILVDESGQPKIIDFGIARVTNADLAVTTMQTDARAIVGTLQYMSPEQADPPTLPPSAPGSAGGSTSDRAKPQAAGDIDIRSDVYSLGIILYELLTGQLPYNVTGSSLTQAAHTICETIPPRPRTIERSLKGDIETIVLKALEKDREHRYQSASDLAADVRRYVNRQPIEAKPPTLWTNAMRCVMRHPLLTTAAACVLMMVTTIAATMTIVWYTNSRPHHIELTADHREAWLRSYSGRILRTWGTPSPSGIMSAELVDDPHGTCRDGIALVTFPRCPGHRYSAHLCAFDAATHDDEPLWESRLEEADLPPQLIDSNHKAVEFTARLCQLFDIFPEIPGEEVLIVFQHGPGSDSVLRVVSMTGETLYQIAHPGNIIDAHWMPDSRLLVLYALNGEAFWSKRGFPDESSSLHPQVLFAIHPRIVLSPSPAAWLDPNNQESCADLVWYKCILPPAFANAWRSETGGDALTLPSPSYAWDRFFKLTLRPIGYWDAACSWVVTDEGIVVQDSRVQSNAYRMLDDPAIPPASLFRLDDLPPIQ